MEASPAPAAGLPVVPLVEMVRITHEAVRSLDDRMRMY